MFWATNLSVGRPLFFLGARGVFFRKQRALSFSVLEPISGAASPSPFLTPPNYELLFTKVCGMFLKSTFPARLSLFSNYVLLTIHYPSYISCSD